MGNLGAFLHGQSPSHATGVINATTLLAGGQNLGGGAPGSPNLADMDINNKPVGPGTLQAQGGTVTESTNSLAAAVHAVAQRTGLGQQISGNFC